MSSGGPPKRDKFAALASHQQQQQQHQQSQQEQQKSQPQQQDQSQEQGMTSATVSVTAAPPPKRDKFASLKAKIETPAAADVAKEASNIEDPVTASVAAVAAAPKGDKFASMKAKAATEDSTLTASPSPASAAAPKRDKFASMQSANTTSSTSAEAPKRDKFAAMATGTAPKRDKFASMASQTPAVTVTAESIQKQKVKEKKDHMTMMTKKCKQRDQVWKDLDNAEVAASRLLKLAEQTATALAVQTLNDEDEDDEFDLQTIQTQYQETVQQLHDLLSPHAELVKAYQIPTRINQMYIQRVEHRLADSKLQLLQDYINEDKEQQHSSGPMKQEEEEMSTLEMAGKRKRED